MSLLEQHVPEVRQRLCTQAADMFSHLQRLHIAELFDLSIWRPNTQPPMRLPVS
jgi:hypothetical protein